MVNNYSNTRGEEQGTGLSRAGYAQVLRPESAVIDVKMSITRNVLKTLAAAAGEKADNEWGRERKTKMLRKPSYRQPMTALQACYKG